MKALLSDDEFGRGPLLPSLQKLVQRYAHVLAPHGCSAKPMMSFGVKRALTDKELHQEFHCDSEQVPTTERTGYAGSLW